MLGAIISQVLLFW